jgi:hypothetical protein
VLSGLALWHLVVTDYEITDHVFILAEGFELSLDRCFAVQVCMADSFRMYKLVDAQKATTTLSS